MPHETHETRQEPVAPVVYWLPSRDARVGSGVLFPRGLDFRELLEKKKERNQLLVSAYCLSVAAWVGTIRCESTRE